MRGYLVASQWSMELGVGIRVEIKKRDDENAQGEEEKRA